MLHNILELVGTMVKINENIGTALATLNLNGLLQLKVLGGDSSSKKLVELHCPFISMSRCLSKKYRYLLRTVYY